MIEIDSLCCGYDKIQILYNVNFSAKNQITAVIGSNGSGKSTLLKSVFGLCDVYSGKIKYNNLDITNIQTNKIIHLGISYMAQKDNVFLEQTIQENLIIASLPDSPDLVETFRIFPVLKQYKNKKAIQLSGGEKQMLAMAMILAKKPKIILLDEPTANLSPKNADIVLDKIKQIQQELDNCIILVEQNIKKSLAICDSCYLFSSGKVIYQGNAEKLLKDSKLVSKYLGIK